MRLAERRTLRAKACSKRKGHEARIGQVPLETEEPTSSEGNALRTNGFCEREGKNRNVESA
jgi:hypothetical protein